MGDWICSLCNSSFSTKTNLKRHNVSKHSRLKKLFECVECGRNFTRKDILQRHVVIHQADPPMVECPQCSKKFRYKCNLTDHITVFHSGADLCLYECAHCTKSFRHRRNLIKHINLYHRSQLHGLDGNIVVPNDVFECGHCSFTFNQKNNLRRHIIRQHLIQKQKTKESRLQCLKCSKVFPYTKELNKHYVQVHGIVLTYEKLEFDSVISYEQWLEKHQHQTITQYPVWYRKSFATYHTEHRICHRSRYFHSKLKADDRKRCTKRNGYKKLGGICPAEIKVRILDNGTCFVTYQKTHIGHNVGDESELGLIFTTKAEKTRIADKIQSGIPLSQIVNQERLSSFSNKNIGRLSLLNRKDVHNIAASRGLNFDDSKLVLPKCNPLDNESEVAVHSDDILFYKRQTEEDSRFNLLRKEDFVLVVMTVNQEKYIRAYGHKVVCVDGTHTTNPYGFVLHSLLVLDKDCESLPAAFLLTNRNDRDVIDIFLTCVRDRIGIVNTQTFISDAQIPYYDSWVKIMKIPVHFIFSTWHVEEAWRRNYCKITNKKKRDDARKELKRLTLELDPFKFETDLNSFLSRKDDDLTKFQNYFRDNYANKLPQWAYCYRTAAGINTNMQLESFHKTYKHFVAGGRKITSLTQYLEFIFKFLDLLETKIYEKKIRGVVTCKLSILRNRHRTAFEQYKEDALSKVVIIDSHTFFVQSFGQRDTLYVVSKYESKECAAENEPCGLVCDLCNLCFHTFKCTCEDSSVTSNMCKHIHLVGLYLKHQMRPSSGSDVEMLHLVSGAEENDENYVCQDESDNEAAAPSTVVDEKNKNTENRTQRIKKSDDDTSVAAVKRKINEIMRMVVNLENESEMNYIYEKFLRPIPAALATFKMELPVQVETETKIVTYDSYY